MTLYIFLLMFSFLFDLHLFAFVVAGNAALCALLRLYNPGHQAFGLIVVFFVFFTDVLSRSARGCRFTTDNRIMNQEMYSVLRPQRGSRAMVTIKPVTHRSPVFDKNGCRGLATYHIEEAQQPHNKRTIAASIMILTGNLSGDRPPLPGLGSSKGHGHGDASTHHLQRISSRP